MPASNLITVLRLQSNYEGREPYFELYPLIKDIIDQNGAIAQIDIPSDDDYFTALIDESYKDDLFNAVGHLEDSITIDEIVLDVDQNVIVSEDQIFPNDEEDDEDEDEDRDEDSNDESEDVSKINDIKENPLYETAVDSVQYANDNESVTEYDNSHIKDETINSSSSIDDLLPSPDRFISELNPIINETSVSRDPVAIITQQQHESNINMLYALMSPQFVDIDYQTLATELERFKQSINPELIPEINSYLKAKKVKEQLTENAKRTEESIKSTYEYNYQQWLEEQTAYLKEQYAIDHPDTTDEQIAELYASIKPQIESAEEEIIKAKGSAEQAVIRNFAQINKNPALSSAMTFLMTKAKAQQAIKTISTVFVNTNSSLSQDIPLESEQDVHGYYGTSSYHNDLEDHNTDDMVYQTSETDNSEKTWYGYSQEDLDNMTDDELIALNEKFNSGELDTYHQPTVHHEEENDEEDDDIDQEDVNFEDENSNDIIVTDSDLANITFDENDENDEQDYNRISNDELNDLEQTIQMNPDNYEIVFTDEGDDSGIQMTPDDTDIYMVEADNPEIDVKMEDDQEQYVEPELDLGQTGTIPDISSIDFDNFDDDTNINVDDELGLTEVNLEDELVDEVTENQSQEVEFDEGLFAQTDEDDLEDFEAETPAQKPTKGRTKKEKSKSDKKSWLSSTVGKVVLGTGAVAILGGTAFGGYMLLNNKPSNNQTTQQTTNYKKFFERASKVGVSLDNVIQVTITEKGEAIEESVTITELNEKDGSIIVERSNGETMTLPYSTVLTYVTSMEEDASNDTETTESTESNDETTELDVTNSEDTTTSSTSDEETTVTE